jgi:hypothetical protein
MSLATRYGFVVFWLSLVALLSAVNFGIATGNLGAFLADYPNNVLSTVEMILQVAVALGLTKRRSWAWGLAATWIPCWIFLHAVELFREGDPVFALTWTPFLVLSALSHHFLLRDEVREGFGITNWPWTNLHTLSAITLTMTAFVPLSLVLDIHTAGALCFACMLIVKTVPLVYDGSHGDSAVANDDED